jgi:hypothetical protein
MVDLARAPRVNKVGCRQGSRNPRGSGGGDQALVPPAAEGKTRLPSGPTTTSTAQPLPSTHELLQLPQQSPPLLPSQRCSEAETQSRTQTKTP